MSANNPFLNANDPSHASSRFPDLSGTSTSYASPGLAQGQSQWLSSNLSYQQQSTFANQFHNQQSQQYPQQSFGGQGGGYMSPTLQTSQAQFNSGFGYQQATGYTPQSSAPHISGTSYSYLSGAQGVSQPQQQLGPAQQQIANNPGYVAQFDPYGPLSQWDGSSGMQQQHQQHYQQQQQAYQNTNYNDGNYLIPPVDVNPGVSPTGDPHPRDIIRTHKSQLDKWDPVAWKQLLSAFEALKNAWAARKTACSTQHEALKSQLNFAGYYQQQVQAEIARVQELVKDADSKFDSVAASTFQMQEVYHSYRQSADASGKARVREATNASVRGLPEWPPATI